MSRWDIQELKRKGFHDESMAFQERKVDFIKNAIATVEERISNTIASGHNPGTDEYFRIKKPTKPGPPWAERFYKELFVSVIMQPEAPFEPWAKHEMALYRDWTSNLWPGETWKQRSYLFLEREEHRWTQMRQEYQEYHKAMDWDFFDFPDGHSIKVSLLEEWDQMEKHGQLSDGGIADNYLTYREVKLTYLKYWRWYRRTQGHGVPPLLCPEDDADD
ncbi:MAG: hypothetical protein A4E58_03273 [Syntrophorhabdus sp. PtaB.Bin006]|nr:MAG: hypothetical protein A4E58_03273 [Syntrophorhabdus sp. PtaB.Bin006]OPY85046.1 MAG: hypothetical protein A4E65_00208 [Syntrophorhabdus sp. PtaU1.Bin153]